MTVPTARALPDRRGLEPRGPAAAPPTTADAPLTWPALARGCWPTTVLCTLLGLVGSAAGLAQPFVVERALGSTTGLRDMVVPGAQLALLMLVGAVVGTTGHLVQLRTDRAVVLRVRERLVARALSLSMARFARTGAGETLTRVTSDAALVSPLATTCLVDLVTGSATVVVAVVLMARVSPGLTAVCLGVLAAVVALSWVVWAPVRRLHRATQERFEDFTTTLDRLVQGMRTIRVAGAAPAEFVATRASADELRVASVKAGTRGALTGTGMSMAFNAAMVVVLGAGAVQVNAGTMPLARLIAFAMVFMASIGPLGLVVGTVEEVQLALAALKRVNELLAVDPHEVPEPGVPGAAAADAGVTGTVCAPAPGGGAPAPGPAVEFCAVTVRHDGDGAPVTALDRATFTVPAGRTTALVGPSGGGKSTVLELLVALRRPDAGRVVVDGRDLREAPVAGHRAQVGHVEQEAPLLQGTLRENLLLGGVQADDDTLLEVLGRVGLTELVARSDLGLDAQVGRQGACVSGGQRQRLAVARAVLRRPRLYLLDEPTAHLDPLSENLVTDLVTDAAARDGATVVVAAHRLSTVEAAHHVVVLEAGRVVDEGTPAELVDRCDLYRGLVTAATPPGATGA